MFTKYLKIIFILAIALFAALPYLPAEDTVIKPASEPPAEEESFSAMSAAPAMAISAEQPPLPAVSPSAIGGAFSSLMSESFKTDLATGAATLGIPIVVPPGRKNVQPNIALSYSSNNPNGICGVGWGVPVSAIQRSTKNGVPYYNNAKDTFLAGGEELVLIEGGGYRAKMESSFTKYDYIEAGDKWIVTDKAGTKYYFGSTEASKLSHPNNSAKTFAWYIDKAEDVYGNAITYEYEKADNVVYPKYIYYTSNASCNPPLTADKTVEFVYESNERPDKIYNNRAGWPSAIKRRLEKIRISIGAEVIWTYNLSYELSSDTSRSLLKSIQLSDSAGNTLPAKTFTYQKLEP